MTERPATWLEDLEGLERLVANGPDWEVNKILPRVVPDLIVEVRRLRAVAAETVAYLHMEDKLIVPLGTVDRHRKALDAVLRAAGYPDAETPRQSEP